MSRGLAIGLMSGTSLDGLDGVLVEYAAHGESYRTRTLAHARRPFPLSWADTVRRIAERNQLREAAYFAAAWSEKAASLVRRLLRSARVAPRQVEAIGAHGQTVVHLPDPRPFLDARAGITIQLADLSRLALATGIPVVGNFRTADVALGGQGAPLAPHAHRLLFGHTGRTLAVQNLGGIGNVTLLRGGRVRLAFDTGPANVWIDTVVRWRTKGRLSYDRGGALAARGVPDRTLVLLLLSHPYFRKFPPKSAGWEQFGEDYLRRFRGRLMGMSPADAVATVTYATALATAESYRRFVFHHGLPEAVVLAGGGARNAFLRHLLSRYLPETRVTTSELFGIRVDQVEAVAFALLAVRAIHGRPNNEPAASGASAEAVCGQIAPAAPGLRCLRAPLRLR
jgi:anhydro-N-acetylmuramic acid kinase